MAIFADLFLRFSWTLTLLPNSVVPFVDRLPEIVTLALAIAEVLRRSMWAAFRVENEHLSNTEQYRRVSFIPLHFDRHKDNGNTKLPGWRVALELAVIGGVVVSLAIAAAITRG
mmetsp:Transcript_13506/g.31981  ORF Transcript_13506/g.31981 Transcript_13506/m.31981 type:complete len:114 (+) Transcript_13506:45-386(+)